MNKYLKSFLVIFLILSLPIFGNATEEYRINVGDTLEITIWGCSQMNVEMQVDQNGGICFKSTDTYFEVKDNIILETGQLINNHFRKYYDYSPYCFQLTVHPFSNPTIQHSISGSDIFYYTKEQAYVSQKIELTDSIFGVGNLYRTYEIFFNSDNQLDAASIVKLNAIADFLLKNNTLEIEIGVHSNKRTVNIYSISTTQIRANLIKTIFILNGVKKNRLIGYQKKEPITADAIKNRRVEVKVIGFLGK